MAWADHVAYLLGIIRGERGQRDLEHECLGKLRTQGVIQ